MPAFSGMKNVRPLPAAIPVKAGIQQTAAKRKIRTLTGIHAIGGIIRHEMFIP